MTDRRRQLIHLPDLFRRLVIREIKISCMGSVLGIVWSLVNSVAQVRVFAFLFRSGMGANLANYPAYVFGGLLVWR